MCCRTRAPSTNGPQGDCRSAQLETDLIEGPQDDGAFGARGIGEHPMVPTIAVVGNAIYDAIVVLVSEPPFPSEKVYMATREAGLVD